MAATQPTFTEIQSLTDQQPTAICRNRKYLAGSESINFPETLSTKSNKSFAAIKLENQEFGDLGVLGKHLRAILDNYMAKDISAVLIKGLPISDVINFQDFVKGANYTEMSYKSGTGFRVKLSDTVYSASDEPAEFSIEPHNEMSYVPEFPTKVFFCCLQAAEIGGENPLVFNRDLIRDLDENVLERFRKNGIQYKRNLKDEKNTTYISWQGTFQTTNKKEAEEAMKSRNMSWKWKENGDLTMSYVLPAFLKHPVTGEELWFNQATANHYTYYKSHPMFEDKQEMDPNEYPYTCCYGNGEEIEDEVIDHIRSVMWKNAMSVRLDIGDVLFVDNLLCQHSRLGYKGRRKIVLQLADSICNYQKEWKI